MSNQTLITKRFAIFLEDQFDLEKSKYLGDLEVKVPVGTTQAELWDAAQAELFQTMYQWERAKSLPYIAPSTQINLYPIP